MASFRQRSKNGYQITVSQGYTTDGKKLFKQKTVKRPDGMTDVQWNKEINMLMVEFEREVERGTYLDGEKITFSEFSDMWMTKYAEKKLEPKTVARYRELLDSRINPAIGHLIISKLRPNHLIDFYNNLAETGIRLDTKYTAFPFIKKAFKDNGYSIKSMANKCGLNVKTASNAYNERPIAKKSAKLICSTLNIEFSQLFFQSKEPGKLADVTVNHHHRIISAILNDAVEWQIITSNPAGRVPVPKIEKAMPKHYDNEQTKNLISALTDEPIKYRTMIILDAFTGFRCGELMGLDWTSDVDLENGVVSVKKVSQYLPGKGTFTKGKPKNDHSIRTASIPPFVISLLKSYKAWWSEQKLACGDMWQGSNRLFVTWDGRPMYTYSLTQWFPKFLERHNLPKLTPHGIRHTFASLLAKKIPIPELSKLLGHARISTTSDIYVHPDDPGTLAGNMLEDLLIEKNVQGISVGIK